MGLGCSARRLAAFLMALVVAGGCSAPDPPPAADPPDPVASVVPSETSPAAADEEATSPPAADAVDLSAAELTEFDVPAGDHPHDVAPAADGRIWYTAQATGALGLFDPASGKTERVELGPGSAPHGVIVGPDDAAWVTDGGQNAIVRVDAQTLAVEVFPLPRPDNANLNTAAFDGRGVLWFTGNAGIYGRLDPASNEMEIFDAPRGAGPYGIAATPDGTVWFSSLAASYIARIDSADGSVSVVDVPTSGGGARRVWSDSRGRLWVTEWYAGKLARYDPDRDRWREWALPGPTPQPYAVYVDERDVVWVTDFGADAIVAFDPMQEAFHPFSPTTPGAAVRQLLGRPDEVWGAGSGTDTLIVVRTGT